MEIRASISLHLHHDQKPRRPALLRLGTVLIAVAIFRAVRPTGEAQIGSSTDVALTANASGSLALVEFGASETSMITQHEPGNAKDDCEIFTLLGRKILGWGKVAPDISQFAIFYRPQGDGYVEQCPWADLGVERLKATKPDPDNMRFFTAPKYGADGQTATVSFVTKLVGRNADGTGRPPFISQEELSLKRIDGHWRLVSRKQGPIT